MLIHYIRTPKKYEVEVKVMDGVPTPVITKITGGDPIGMIISPAKNIVGWSLCGPYDRFKKTTGLVIAGNRCQYYGTDKEWLLSEVPQSILQEVLDMYNRSTRYYK